ncbi:MAG: DUF3800 domain-containing protein [Candidatus Marinimicrobia bacterium]|nr:DUF3800 domain-containing protein [Candidatus Neomarinimicrobiota bacterium]
MYIYLDESGDLGFDYTKAGTTSFFVITILVCETRAAMQAIQRAVKRTRRNKLSFRVEELKGTNTTLAIKQYFSYQIKNSDWGLYTVILNKKRVIPALQTRKGKKKLYNFLSREIIDKIKFPEDLSNLTLVVDKMKNKFEIRDFNRYIENQLEAYLPLNCLLYLYHKDSKEHPGLQAVDQFCWGIFRKYSQDDYAWYNCFKEKIRYETVYLP